MAPAQVLPKLILEEALTPAQMRRIKSSTGMMLLIKVPSEDWVMPLEEHLASHQPLGHLLFHVKDGSGRRRLGNASYGLQTFLEWIASGKTVVAIAHNPAADFAREVISAIDLTVTLGPPSARLVARAIGAVTGKRASPLPDDIAAGLGLVDLCAAIRSGSTPAQCVARLQRAARAKTVTDAVPADVPHINDLHGYGEAKVWAQALLDDLSLWRAGQIAFTDIESRAVLGSAPGLGKTTFARSLARSANLPLFATSVGQWFSGGGKGHLGDVTKQIDEVFGAAVAAAPAILFLDELDALPDRRTLSDRTREWWTSVVTHVLTRLDGAASATAQDLIIVGATNYPERLDDALLRPGRFSKVIRIGLPSSAELVGIFRQHLGPDLPDTDLTLLGQLATGATGAHVAGWVKTARRRARQAQRPLHMEDLFALVAPDETRPAEEVRRVAVHEAAHAVTGHLLGLPPVSGISIVQRGDIGGYSALEDDVSTVLTCQDLEAFIQMHLAGRCAEIVFFGEASSGAGGHNGSDLARATQLATVIETSLGLGDSLTFRSGYDQARLLLSSDVQLRVKVEARLQRLHEQTLDLVRTEQSLVERIAEELMAKRFMDGETFRRLVTS